MQDQTLNHIRDADQIRSKIEDIATALDYSTAATADWALRYAVTQDQRYLSNAMYCAGLKEAFEIVLTFLTIESDGRFEMSELHNGFRFSIVDRLREKVGVDFAAIGNAFI